MSDVGWLRIAIHGYNTVADIERFWQVLHDILKRMK